MLNMVPGCENEIKVKLVKAPCAHLSQKIVATENEQLMRKGKILLSGNLKTILLKPFLSRILIQGYSVKRRMMLSTIPGS